MATEVWFRDRAISAVDVAWAAGIFEGEGSFTPFTGGSGKRYMGLQVNMSDEDVVERLHKVWGAGTFAPWHPPSHKSTGRKPQYRWRVSGKKAEEIFWIMAPHLGKRRRARFIELAAEIRDFNSERSVG